MHCGLRRANVRANAANHVRSDHSGGLKSLLCCRDGPFAHDHLMQAIQRKRRSHDPRRRRRVHQNGGDELARRFKVPDSTIRSWRRAPPPTVAEDALDVDSAERQAVIAKLERRVAALNAIMTLFSRLSACGTVDSITPDCRAVRIKPPSFAPYNGLDRS